MTSSLNCADYKSPYEETADANGCMVSDVRIGEDGGTVIGKRRRVTLLAVSGGLDSVYTLVKLLRESEDEVIAHHIHMLNAEQRHQVEAAYLQRIFDYCRTHYRPFHITESTVDRRGLAVFTPDIFTAAFEAGLIAASFELQRGVQVDRMTRGVCWEERIVTLKHPKPYERFEHLQRILTAAAFPHHSPYYFELPIITKEMQAAYLGKDLTELCWTCSLPRHEPDGSIGECGGCKKCVIMAEIRENLGFSAPAGLRSDGSLKPAQV